MEISQNSSMPLLATLLTVPLCIAMTYAAFFVSTLLLNGLEMLGLHASKYPVVGVLFLTSLIGGAHLMAYRILTRWQPSAAPSVRILAVLLGIILTGISLFFALVISGIS